MSAVAGDVNNPKNRNNRLLTDSVVSKMIFFAPTHEKIVNEYRAHLYMKGRLNIVKKNFAFDYIPKMFKLKRGVNEYLVESSSDLHYTAPNIYDQKVKAIYGTTTEGKFQAAMLEYFHINIYSQTLLNDKLLSPLAQNASKYYRYSVDSIMEHDGVVNYRLRFIPKTKSDQLVGGYMVVSADVWSVREMRIIGRTGLLTFQNDILMGVEGDDSEFLPVSYNMSARFRLGGNVVDCHYLTYLDYSEIEIKESVARIKEKRNLDMTNSYSLRCDTNAFHRDSTYFNSIRPIALTESEKTLYINSNAANDSLTHVAPKHSKVLCGEVGDFLINDININLSSFGYVKCSPIINPFLLSYSKSNGFAWQQNFKFNRLYSGSKLLHIEPRIGYNFTKREFYWSVNTDFSYLPRRRGTIHINVGNGNRIYSSDVLNDLKSMPDSTFNFDAMQLNYYYDLFFSFRHSIEITNGLELSAGLSIHRRTPVTKYKFPSIDDGNVVPKELVSHINSKYISFAPHLRLTWTPGMYYYMNGSRKMNVRSDYPTFSVDYERGVKGVFKSTGEYEKVEIDMQQKINMQLMRNFFYRVGVGFFTKQEETYFVDFTNFSRSNLPTGWNDDIGGVFQLLDRRWYNSSRNYVRGNITYEAPFMLLRHLKRYTRYVQNERLYAGVLFMPHLNPYMEFGYGIGTHIFDFGVFVGMENWSYSQVGCKFTFELFNR